MATRYGTNTGDFLDGTAGADSIYGWDITNAAGDFGPSTDNDQLTAAGNDLLNGGGGDDILTGGFGHDTMLGGAGNDQITNAGGDGSNVLDGGAGIDLYVGYIDPSNAVTLSVLQLGNGIVLADGTQVSGFERAFLFGSAEGDSLTGGLYDDTLSGNEGDDTLRGGDGNDVLQGGQGADQLFGGNGDDTVSVIGSFGADVVRGGLGIDLLVYQSGGNLGTPDVTFVLGYSVTLPDGTLATGFERLDYLGTDGVDNVTGGNWDDYLNGGIGNDVLTGRGGNDILIASTDAATAGVVTLYGGAGDDTLVAHLQDGSLLSGGEGIDLAVLDYQGASGRIVLNLADLATGYLSRDGGVIKGVEQVDLIGSVYGDDLTGGAFSDSLDGYIGQDSLSGGAGDDHLNGGRGDDTLNGGEGNDVLFESQGVNVMFGAGGDDVISVDTHIQKGQFMYGGAGDDNLSGSLLGDVLNGGAGSDVLLGRTGADRFTFNAAPVAGEVDTIRDFGVGADKIVLSASAFAGLVAGNLSPDDFVAGTAALDASDRIIYDAATHSVWYDADGLGGVAAVQFLTINAFAAFGADDFLIV